MKARLLFLPSCALVLTLVGAGTSHAQCPFQQPNPWNGDEPPEFTHYLDDDGDGVCDGDEAAKVNGVFENRTYPDCTTVGGYHQFAHGHWEYTHLQAEVPCDTEEKDYLDTTKAPDAMIDQTLRFATKEPIRFYRALSPTQNPSGNYWQVDEWIGPQGVPLLTWTERFFECSAPENCASIGGTPAAGGYWGTQPGDFGYPDASGCGDGVSADGPRSPCCGIFFPLP
jgi:hypothetical protein